MSRLSIGRKSRRGSATEIEMRKSKARASGRNLSFFSKAAKSAAMLKSVAEAMRSSRRNLRDFEELQASQPPPLVLPPPSALPKDPSAPPTPTKRHASSGSLTIRVPLTGSGSLGPASRSQSRVSIKSASRSSSGRSAAATKEERQRRKMKKKPVFLVSMQSRSGSSSSNHLEPGDGPIDQFEPIPSPIMMSRAASSRETLTVIDCSNETTVYVAHTEPWPTNSNYYGNFKFRSIKDVPIQISITSRKPIAAVFHANADHAHNLTTHLTAAHLSTTILHWCMGFVLTS
eukprot:712811_1